MSDIFTDLDTSTIDRQHAVVLVAEFLVWWHQAGQNFCRRGQVDEDGGLQIFANDVVSCVGGWREARRILRAAESTAKTKRA